MNEGQQAIAEYEAQPVLEAGTQGWWKVWGATPHSIRPGDIVMMKNDLGNVDTFYVEDTFTAKAAPMRVGIIVGGARQTIGALCTVAIVRRGTHGTLA